MRDWKTSASNSWSWTGTVSLKMKLSAGSSWDRDVEDQLSSTGTKSAVHLADKLPNGISWKNRQSKRAGWAICIYVYVSSVQSAPLVVNQSGTCGSWCFSATVVTDFKLQIYHIQKTMLKFLKLYKAYVKIICYKQGEKNEI